MRIDREDMLELTRRMTTSRFCFSRVAGAYVDEEGEVEGTFNTQFRNLTKQEQARHLEIAKVIPFSKTNEQVKCLDIDKEKKQAMAMRQVLLALKECELKNDALMYSLYEYIGDRYQPGRKYALMLFFGSFDIPKKGSDKVDQWDSEEVFNFMIGAVCPMNGEYEAGKPYAGFLYPAYMNHCADLARIQIFEQAGRCEEVKQILFS
ncbi:MAG: DUF4317 family protein [Lachnospiraceae bacterium]|jgi:hypothetical protein|nr:DUF4317 family protein [Lachnospiraceae bacterium]